MGLFLMAVDYGWFLVPSNYLVVFQVCFALGLVIFVHELGHFAVAKMCGVKCEKFYVGFDIGGYKLFKFQWGETEYGIGVLPLGGYVKMLGQEDNPSRVREEMEKARLHNEQQAAGEQVDAPPAVERVRPDDEAEAPFELDQRSYLAQSVPKRMAIISAGVIMNVIFAWVFASIAYGLGVDYRPCIISSLVPGEAAWKAGLRIGDELVQVGDIKQPRFKDLKAEIALGDIDGGVPLVVRRPGVEELLHLKVYPDRKSETPTIGVDPPVTTILKGERPARPFTPAARASQPFEQDDRIVRIDDTPVQTYADLNGALAIVADQRVVITVERQASKADDSADASLAPREISIDVDPNPMQRFGLVMKMGPIAAVRPASPAEAAGLKPGDLLKQIDGQPVGNPTTLPDRLRRLAGQQVTLGIERAGKPLSLTTTLQQPDGYETPSANDSPMSAPALGIAYPVWQQVAGVEAGSPAEKAGLKAGDRISSVKVLLPADLKKEEKIFKDQEFTVEFEADSSNWPTFFFSIVQNTPPGTQFEFAVEGREQPVSLTTHESDEWFIPQRGLALKQLFKTRTAESATEAMVLGRRETWESLTMVVRFLQKIGRQVSFKAIGGPGSILYVAGLSAERGTASLLIFLCMLSANLAVVNFLPIPVLDGGHMVFLAYEGLFRKPVSERVFVIFTYLGFLFILTLMVFALGLDFTRFVL